jgi:hypothetical protein
LTALIKSPLAFTLFDVVPIYLRMLLAHIRYSPSLDFHGKEFP